MTQPDLIITEGLLEECQAWQEVINAQSSGHDMDQAGLEAKSRITAPDSSVAMLVHGEQAIADLADNPIAKSKSPGVLEFDEILARGVLARIDYLRVAGKGMLTWTVASPEVKNIREARAVDALAENSDGTEVSTPVGRELYVPLYFPVARIKSAIFAGRNSYRLSPRFYQDVPEQNNPILL
jgi:hypothetical protein